MAWRKQGLIYAPSGNRWWARSYATVPTADVMDDQRIRVYFTSLDENRYGRIGYVDLDTDNPSRILDESAEPVLDIGELGTFDDSGVTPSCIINVQGKKYLYYNGWQRCERVPYMIFSGLAVSADNGTTFQKFSRVPVLGRTDQEPFLRSAPSVLHDGDLFQAWYVSGLKWIVVHDMQYPSYVIRSAESNDGIVWHTREQISIGFADDAEFGLSRSWVIKARDMYRMWYSIRSRVAAYRLGYAESRDGLHWERKDNEVGIERSDSGWDSEMVCYPCVVDVKGKRYMFYNGNRHGSTGFGYATWEPN